MTPKGNHQPLKGSSNRKLEENMDTSLKAYKACGEIGYIAKECPDEWPHYDTNYPTEEYPTQVTCFLCGGNNHVPAQCQLYPMVLHVSQQAKEGMLCELRKTSEDEDLKGKRKRDTYQEDFLKYNGVGDSSWKCPE